MLLCVSVSPALKQSSRSQNVSGHILWVKDKDQKRNKLSSIRCAGKDSDKGSFEQRLEGIDEMSCVGFEKSHPGKARGHQAGIGLR